MPEICFIIMFFIFGCVMGSFYHVVATRISNEESIITPPSHCNNCNHKLSWYENIPIISFLIQKGKCRNCGAKIPFSCLVSEIVTGVLFAVCFHCFKLTPKLVISLIFISALITVIISDIEYMIILDEILIFSSLLIVVLDIIFFGLEQAAYNIYAGVGAFLSMYAIKILGDKMFKKESLGGGDIKLMFLFGLVIGYPLAICTIFLATFIAFPIAIIIYFTDKENIIPFGPFLSMAAILILISKINFTDILNFLVK